MAVTGWPGAAPGSLLENENHDVRLEAIRELGVLSDPVVIPFLTAALRDPDFRVRRDAAGALAQHGPDAAPAAEELARLLYDPSPFVRDRALVALTAIGSPRATEAVLAFLAVVDPGARDQVLVALGQLGSESVVDAVAPYAEDPDPFVRRAAIEALAGCGARGARTLRRLLDASEPSTRCRAAVALGLAGQSEDLERLRPMADQDPDPHVRACAIGALGRLGDREAVDRLAVILGDPESPANGTAADALALVGSTQAAAVLVDALPRFGYDDNPALRALIALGDIARVEMLASLGHVTDDHALLIADGLSVLGRPRDVPALRAAQEGADASETERAWGAAIAAIESRPAL